MTLLSKIYNFLKNLFSYKEVDTSNTAERSLTNSQGKTKVLNTVVPLVGYDVDTGDFFTLGTWTQPQTFNGEVALNDDTSLAQGKKLYMDTDQDTYIYCGSDDVIQFYAANQYIFRCVSTGFVVYRKILVSGYQATFQVMAAAPSAEANRAHIYSKDVGGKAHMFAMDEDGNEFDLTV